MGDSRRRRATELPDPLRNFLTVTEVDGAPRSTQVKPSPLLGRLQGFLPKLAAANEKLTYERPSNSGVKVTKVGTPTAEETEDEEGLYEKPGGLSVDMDLYVDEGLGKLVAGVEALEGEKGDDEEAAAKEKADKEGADKEGANKQEMSKDEASGEEQRKARGAKRPRPLIQVVSETASLTECRAPPRQENSGS